MTRNRRRSTAAAVLASGTMLLTGIGGSLAAGSPARAAGRSGAHAVKTVHIAMFGYNTTPYSIAALDATKAAAKRFGATVTFFNSNSSATTQATQMRDAIQTGNYQAFWVWANDSVALEPIVRQAQKAGIKVATADATLGTLAQSATIQAVPGVTVALGVGLLQEAQVAVSTIESACSAQVGPHKACHVALMPGFDNFPPDVYRLGYIVPKLKATGYITTSMMPQGQYSTPGAQQSTLNFYQTQPKVNVIYTFADQMVAGILTALKQQHVTPGKGVKLIGFGATTEAVQGIKGGQWYASQGLYPATESSLAVQYLTAAVRGKKVPRVVNLYSVPGGLPVIDKAVLQKNPKFQPNWSYGG